MSKYTKQGIIKSSFLMINELIASSAIVFISIFCGLLSIICVFVYGNSILADLVSNGLEVKSYFVSAIVLFLFIFTLYSFINRRKHINPVLFIGVSVVVSLAIQWFYYSVVHANWVSDFQHMWNIAGQMSAQGRLIPNDIYEQRVLPILLPLVYIFGNNPVIVPIANSCFLIGIMLIGYSILQKTRGHYVAQIFTILWMACAEPLFALKIPTHDLWGLFIIACIFFVIVIFFYKARKSLPFTLAMGVVAGLLCIMLDMQRELGALVIVAWIVTLAIYAIKNKSDQQSTSRHVSYWAMLVVACVVFLSGNAVLKHTQLIVNSDSLNYLKYLRIASLSPGYSPGTYAYAHNFGNGLLGELPPKAQKETALSLLLSDYILQPEFRIYGIIYKTNLMAYLGGQHYFYQNGMDVQSPVLLKNIVNYNKILSLIICFLLLIKLKSALKKDESISTIFSLSLLCILIGALTTVGEAQSRYLFPFWFFSSIIIASQYRVSEVTEDSSFRLKFYFKLGSATILLGAAFLWLLSSNAYKPEDGRVLSPFSLKVENERLPSYSPPLQLDKNAYTGRSNGIGKLGFTLLSPRPTEVPVQISAAKELCVREKTSFRFGYVMPYINPQVDGAFQLSLYFSGREVWSQRLPDDGKIKNVVVENIAPENTCGKLEFTLSSKDRIFDESWVQASRTEIYFPRLTQY